MAAPLPSNEADLVALAQGGRDDAFGELYNRYFPRIYDFLARMLRDRTEAADVSQETFVRAIESIGQLRQPESFKSWLYTIARRRALDRLAKSGRDVTVPPVTEDEGLNPLLSLVDDDRLGSPEEVAEAHEIAEVVWDAAAGLDLRTYEVMDLHVRQGLPSAEIAEVMGVSKGNAYTMVSRMKSAIRNSLTATMLARSGREACEELAALVGPESSLTADTKKAINAHCETCETCMATLEGAMEPLRTFGALALVPPAEGTREAIWLAIQAALGGWAADSPPVFVRRTSSLIGRLWRFAAAAILGLGVVGVVIWAFGDGDGGEPVEVLGATITTAPDSGAPGDDDSNGGSSTPVVLTSPTVDPADVTPVATTTTSTTPSGPLFGTTPPTTTPPPFSTTTSPPIPPGTTTTTSTVATTTTSAPATTTTTSPTTTSTTTPLVVALDDEATTNEDEPVVIAVLVNDSVSIDPASVTISTQATSGTAVPSIDGSITYTPDADFNGSDSFVYRVTDSGGSPVTATVTVTVVAVNDAPFAPAPVALSSSEDTSTVFDPLAFVSDVDGDPLVLTNFDSVSTQGGTVVLGSLIYTPPPDFHGTDGFTFTVSDGTESVLVPVTVDVTPVNDPPVGEPPTIETPQDTPIVFDVLGNYTDPDGDPLTFVFIDELVTEAGGKFLLTLDDFIHYFPPPGYVGPDTLKYNVSDGAVLVPGVVPITVLPQERLSIELTIDPATVFESQPDGSTCPLGPSTVAFTAKTTGADSVVVTVIEPDGGTETPIALKEIVEGEFVGGFDVPFGWASFSEVPVADVVAKAFGPSGSIEVRSEFVIEPCLVEFDSPMRTKSLLG